MSSASYTTNVGDRVVIWITATIGNFIAEVVQADPLQLKVEESGPLAHLKNGDFIIQELDTARIQQDDREDTCVFLETETTAGHKVLSGLRSLGCEDNHLHEILPAPASA